MYVYTSFTDIETKFCSNFLRNSSSTVHWVESAFNHQCSLRTQGWTLIRPLEHMHVLWSKPFYCRSFSTHPAGKWNSVSVSRILQPQSVEIQIMYLQTLKKCVFLLAVMILFLQRIGCVFSDWYLQFSMVCWMVRVFVPLEGEPSLHHPDKKTSISTAWRCCV